MSRQYDLGWLPGEVWVNIFEVHQLLGGQTDDDGKLQERSRLDSLLNISLTCRGFYHLVRPILYRTLDFQITGNPAGLAVLVDTLVEDPDVWQYVRQVRLSSYIASTGFSDLKLGTGAPGEDRCRLLVHLEALGISSTLIGNLIQENLKTGLRDDIVATVLLCLCRNVRNFDLDSAWRLAGKAGASTLLREILLERDRIPTLAASQAHGKLTLDRRPCAEIRSLRIYNGISMGIEDVGPLLALPSLLSFHLKGISTRPTPSVTYKHPETVPSWRLQSLKIEKCAVSACLVVDLLRACRQLRHLDLDVRHTPGRPAFRYDHLAETLMRCNPKLETLICRDYSPNNRVAFLEVNVETLRPLASLKILAFPLSIMWNLHRGRRPSFGGVLPVSLKELRIFALRPSYSDGAEDLYAPAFLELMTIQQYPELQRIRIGEHEDFAKSISRTLEENVYGWKADWDPEDKEHVYTRIIEEQEVTGY